MLLEVWHGQFNKNYTILTVEIMFKGIIDNDILLNECSLIAEFY